MAKKQKAAKPKKAGKKKSVLRKVVGAVEKVAEGVGTAIGEAKFGGE